MRPSNEYHDIRYKLVMAVEKELRSLQDDGYMTPENADMEVAIAISITTQNLMDIFMNLVRPDEYILVDNKFYLKSALPAPTDAPGQGEEQ